MLTAASSKATIKLDFVVIDTEGKTQLREIAIVDSQGKLIYEAFAAEHPDNYHRVLKKQSLRNILLEFRRITDNKIIVFHNATHDIAVLKNSFKREKLSWYYLENVECTCNLAREYFVGFHSYSLQSLAQKLNLKVEQQYFNPRQAHTARYDAQFTYQLYLAIKTKNKMNAIAQSISNPFSSSRVDNPFQNHPDNSNIYRSQYEVLESIIDDIKNDRNHQSKGAVIIGEPGTGKTHLIMRLAHNRLKHNRLLFIPCPNDADTVKYHTYSCILESLNKKIPETNYNQLEYLLAYSFFKIISTEQNPSQAIISIIERTRNNPLALYNILGREGTDTRRRNWDIIERITTNWWSNQYGVFGYSPEIIKGIVRFCRYSDPNYKQLVKRWLAADELEPEALNKIGLKNSHEQTSREDFSIEAIAVLGRLSLLSEPLIIVFDQLEMLALEHNKNILHNFGEVVKEIFTRVPHSLIILNLFPSRWQQFQQTFDGSIIDRISQQQVTLKQPTVTEIKGILELKTQEAGTNLDNLFTEIELQKILSKKRSIRAVVNHAADYYRYKFKNIPIPKRESESEDTYTADISQPEILARLTKIETQYARLEELFKNIADAFVVFSNNRQVSPASDLNINNNSVVNNGLKPSKTNIDNESSATKTNDEIIFDNPLEQSLESKIKNYLQNTRQKLEREYSLDEILIDEKDCGKLKDIIEAFNKIIPLETDILPSRRVLPPHLVISNKNLCIGFLSSARSNRFTSRIQNFNEIVATQENFKFQLWRDVRADTIARGTVGERAITSLNNTKNSEFLELDRENRITFELIYKIISDIYNQDLDIDLDTELKAALEVIRSHFQDYWLISVLF